MSVDELIQAKIYRLEELKKYQSYYGPNTPYPVIVEINDLEVELQRMLSSKSHSTQVVKKKTGKKPKAKTSFWQMSRATVDAIATIAFIGLVFLFGSIVFAAYVRTRPHQPNDTPLAYINPGDPPIPTLRPTFTPTSDPNSALLTVSEGANDSTSYLPTPGEVATEVPTPVPTLTPSATPPPTDTPMPVDTSEPVEESPPAPAVVAPPVAAPLSAAPAPSAADPPAAAPAAVVPTSVSPTSAPAPGFPFAIAEQGNREFQKTNYHVITIYIAAVSAGNIPIGGLKVIGDHVPSGMHIESGLSDWNWSVVNCLDCDYIKQGNIKFEPGTFADGVWNIYLADQSGTPLSPVVPLSYSADPAQWVWDFILFKRDS